MQTITRELRSFRGKDSWITTTTTLVDFAALRGSRVKNSYKILMGRGKHWVVLLFETSCEIIHDERNGVKCNLCRCILG